MLRVLDAGNLHTSHRCCVIVKGGHFYCITLPSAKLYSQCYRYRMKIYVNERPTRMTTFRERGAGLAANLESTAIASFFLQHFSTFQSSSAGLLSIS